jgi:hypothetical protein
MQKRQVRNDSVDQYNDNYISLGTILIQIKDKKTVITQSFKQHQNPMDYRNAKQEGTA